MGNVTDLESVRESIKDNDPHFNAHALCLNCHYKWIAVVHFTTSLFTLECPKCLGNNSFGSIIPREYLDAHGLE